MRYKFEVGDYVKLIANKTISSKPIGYIGKVLRTKMFSGFGVCCALDLDNMSWSQFSDLAPATKTEYEAYHKPKFPEYIECTQTKEHYFIKGNIYKVTYVSTLDSVRVTSNIKCSDCDAGDELWVTCQDKDGTYYKASTKEAYEQQNKPKPKFKVGDKVRLLVDKFSESLYPQAEYYAKDLIRSGSSAFIVDRVTDNGRPEWNNQFIRLKGYSYVHPVNCFELAEEDEYSKRGTIVVEDKELCGYKVVKPEDSSVISIGCKSISRGEVQGFLNVCEKFDITKVMSGYIKGKSITLDAIKEALK